MNCLVNLFDEFRVLLDLKCTYFTAILEKKQHLRNFHQLAKVADVNSGISCGTSRYLNAKVLFIKWPFLRLR
jgi:hypothetical protein